MREEPPRRMARLHCRLRGVADEPPARVELLHKSLRKFGTVTNTLSAAGGLTGELEAIPSGGAT